MIAVGPMIDRDHKIQRGGGQHRELTRSAGTATALRGKNRDIAQHLHAAGAPAFALLQPDRHGADAAEAGAVADQHQDAAAGQQGP